MSVQNPSQPQKSIYIADDEPNIRQLIQSFLENAGYQVTPFENGDLLYQKFLAKPADMVIIDIMMPGTDGLSLCGTLRQISAVPIIIVSARDSELDRITGITIGSDDYLVKPFSPIELVTRVNAIFRRMSMMQTSERRLTFSDLEIFEKTREIRHMGKIFEVSPTEYDFLCYLFKNYDRAVSREELLQHVWQFEYEVDTRATDDVVKRLRKKLATTHVRIGAVWGFGFRLEDARDQA